MTSAVLLLAHGTPNVLGEMAEYLSKVTGGGKLPDEVVEELKHRYAQIGLGETPGDEAPPLTKWTMEQGRLLEEALGGTRRLCCDAELASIHRRCCGADARGRRDACEGNLPGTTELANERGALSSGADGCGDRDGCGFYCGMGGASVAGAGVRGEALAGLGGGLC